MTGKFFFKALWYVLGLCTLSLLSSPADAQRASREKPKIYFGIVGHSDQLYSLKIKQILEEMRKLQNLKATSVSSTVEEGAGPSGRWDVENDWRQIPRGYTHYIIADYEPSEVSSRNFPGPKWSVSWHEGRIVNTKEEGPVLTYFGKFGDPLYIALVPDQTKGEIAQIVDLDPSGELHAEADAKIVAERLASQFGQLYPEVAGPYRYFVRCLQPPDSAGRITLQLWDSLRGEGLDSIHALPDLTKVCTDEDGLAKSDLSFGGSVATRPNRQAMLSLIIEKLLWTRRNNGRGTNWVPYYGGSEALIDKAGEWAARYDSSGTFKDNFCAGTDDLTSDLPKVMDAIGEYLRASVKGSKIQKPSFVSCP